MATSLNFKLSFPTGYQVEDVTNDNIDLNIILEDGSVYFSTLFTILNIRRIMDNNSLLYFSSVDMLILRDLELDTIKTSIAEIVAKDQIDTYFSRIGSEVEVFGSPPEFGEIFDVYFKS